MPSPDDPLSPVPSFQDTFSTALSSPVDDDDSRPTTIPASLVPPQGLRKSISVDSFVQLSRDASRAARQQPPQTQDASHQPVYSLNADSDVRQQHKYSKSNRIRGESIGSGSFDTTSSVPFDSDGGRYVSPGTAVVIDRLRRPSLNNQDPPSARAGDLGLPARPRLQTSTSTSSTASSPSSSQNRDFLPIVHSTSSLQAHLRRPIPHVSASSGRARSGSLGVNMGSSGKKSLAAPTTTSPSHRSSSSIPHRDVVVAVIGTTGCGKSSLIRKALGSNYTLHDSVVYAESPHPSRLPRYIRRRATPLLDLHHFPPVDAIEVEIQSSSDSSPPWPKGLPPMDAVVLCYDSSDKNSYRPIETLLKHYRSTPIALGVFGCKSDLPREVHPGDVLKVLQQYDTGLIEVTRHDQGKEKMRQAFDYLLRSVLSQRSVAKGVGNRNPFSPDFITHRLPGERTSIDSTTSPFAKPSPTSATTATTTSTTTTSISVDIPSPIISEEPIQSATTSSPTSPLSPIITVPGGIPNNDNDPPKPAIDGLPAHSLALQALTSPLLSGRLHPDEKRTPKKETRSTQRADLDELLDKLLFLSISGDDPTFTTHFLLTYRRFATPRSVLLAMQKRMRQLDNPSGDPMFACFAQMRICHLLETWIRDFPHDFSVKGTAGALNALIKSIISKTHLLHYGSELLPFLEQLPELEDQDGAWALKVEEPLEIDSDDEDEDEALLEQKTMDSHSSQRSKSSVTKNTHNGNNGNSSSNNARDRKPSLPLAKSLISPYFNGHENRAQFTKQQLKELQKLAEDVRNVEAREIAEEITRQEVKLFLSIKPRDWLHYTFVSVKRHDEPIVAINAMANQLGDWVVALIACHERPRHQVRQIEAMFQIAQKLRQMNNYSGLRSFVAGINVAADESLMKLFQEKYPESAKTFKSWDVLLQQIRAHRSYRMALRNSKGGCIPALEVHISDLIRAHEGNPDFHEESPKIHWGKFNMMGRFISSTLQCQAQCRNTTDYDFPERKSISDLFTTRIAQALNVNMSDPHHSYHPLPHNEDDDEGPSAAPPEAAGFRRLFFW